MNNIKPNDKTKIRPWEIILALISAACMIWFYYDWKPPANTSMTTATAPPSEKVDVPTEDEARIMAATLCEVRVKDSMKSPRTADFPWVKDISFDGSTATLVSYVDAENSFGAMIRTHYVCTVDYLGGEPSAASSWNITNLVMTN